MRTILWCIVKLNESENFEAQLDNDLNFLYKILIKKYTEACKCELVCAVNQL